MPQTIERRLAGDRLLNRKDLCRMLGVSVSTLRRWEESGEMPEPMRIGRARRWQPHVIREWLADLEDECHD